MKDRRLGKFYIGGELLDDCPTIVKKIMAKCIILRAECLYAENIFEYLAISKNFRKVPLGCAIPTYRWVIENGKVRCE